MSSRVESGGVQWRETGDRDKRANSSVSQTHALSRWSGLGVGERQVLRGGPGPSECRQASTASVISLL